ncbi:cytokine-dependent hematopoietic cell linker [Callorhinchus milii]|uniref:SH2 domain-containing protein n=1 Tax=Callorhinchus milii TaxID=7868 RepID=A0A4W3HTW4_CALMI|nr:cytokine-dependent hematopoietic cell linker [Callorhinchus milii]|eukprot:gi/632943841/ref/XP_007887175.1/ PREDICTED: cytokine-dependent hematopoietic cell linker [Callorhinchus milii]
MNRDPPIPSRGQPIPSRGPPILSRDLPLLSRDPPLLSRDLHSPSRDQLPLSFRPKPPIPQSASTSNRISQIPVKPSQDMPRRPEMQSSPRVQNAEHFSKLSAKDLEGNDWYVSSYDRYEAERALTETNKDGSFLVRDSSKKSPDQPYVLVVYYGSKVYNIQIRYFGDSKQYALGTGLRGHDIFDSVSEMIQFHRNIPLRLIDRRDQTGIQMEHCILTSPVGPY